MASISLAAGRGARTAINRAYYAAFYAVLALLQALGKTPRKHRGVLTLFDTECVRTGRLPKDLSAALHQLKVELIEVKQLAAD
jgi:uncharacterized protein (UPF0332 family)